MEKAFELLELALKASKELPHLNVEMVDVSMGYDADGKPTAERLASIHVRIVSCPRHAKSDT